MTGGLHVIDRVTVPEAAQLMHITEGAIRQRIHRGTLRSDKDPDGRVYVYVSPEDMENNTDSTPEDDSNGTPLYDELKGRIRFLERELEDRKEESRRKDTIIAQMNQTMGSLVSRIPELEGTSEAAESAVSHADGEEKGVVPPQAQNRSWWRRMFTT
jgi:hypothetical protein